MFTNSAQVLIACESRRVRIAMLPDARSCTWWDQDLGMGRMRVETGIHAAFIVTAIGGKPFNGNFDLL